MEIKILGSGCANCQRLEALVKEVAVEKDLEATFLKVTDYKDIMSYGIMHTPGLVVNGKLLSAGRIPSKQEIATWLEVAQR
ncbi:MAG: thioredoxin family protein [Chloroflexi bacterium]|nr:thioredoxin family protein [Chloroflexota bacterium]